MIGLTVPVRDATGRSIELELRARDTVVELWCHDCLCASFTRDHLRAWLGDPSGKELAVGGVTWIPSTDGVVLSVPPAFVSYLLSPSDMDRLRAYF